MESELTIQYFLSNLSHEIRTPLNGIVGYTQLLLQTQMDSNQHNYLSCINRCSLQLIQLINDILDFSRLVTDKMTINTECFTFKDVINEVDSALGYKIKEKQQRCTYSLSNDLPEYIVSDKSKIVQILINIISNANKFTKVGGRIIVSIVPKKNNVIEFSIEDNGIGIDRKHQDKLFDAFYQVNESIIKPGTGLGLAICKKLVNLLGGKIEVESSIGHGTILTFSIKYEIYENFFEKINKDCAILENKCILLIDSDRSSRLNIGELLFEYKMKPVICSSAVEAIKLLSKKRYPFSLCILDVCVEDMSGSELSKKIKSIAPDLPLIAMSTFDDPLVITQYEYVIQKPIHNIMLLDYITKSLNKDNIEHCILSHDDNDEPKHIDTLSKKILITEDVEYNLNMLSKMLESSGYKNVHNAIDGQEAIDKIEENRENPFDILLLDLKMPKIDGFGVIEHIRKNGYKKPKIAVLTASILETDKELCKQLGVKYFILKPINMNHLKIVLNYLSS